MTSIFYGLFQHDLLKARALVYHYEFMIHEKRSERWRWESVFGYAAEHFSRKRIASRVQEDNTEQYRSSPHLTM